MANRNGDPLSRRGRALGSIESMSEPCAAEALARRCKALPTRATVVRQLSAQQLRLAERHVGVQCHVRCADWASGNVAIARRVPVVVQRLDACLPLRFGVCVERGLRTGGAAHTADSACEGLRPRQ